MQRNVLILDGSPRKGGNTDILCKSFSDGALSNGNEVRTMFVRDLDIHYCTGCDGCVKSLRCVHSDDMVEVEKAMRWADVYVFAAPVYFYTIPAQIKALIDRMVPFYQDLHDKDVYIIVCAADPNNEMLELAVDSFRGLTRDCMEGCSERGVIKAGGIFKKGEVEGTEFLNRAFEMGRSV